MPDCCAGCVFWQTLRGASDETGRDRWAHRTEQSFGPWGRMLRDGDAVLGLLQYGPARAFPRAQVLPAGPPDRDRPRVRDARRATRTHAQIAVRRHLGVL